MTEINELKIRDNLLLDKSYFEDLSYLDDDEQAKVYKAIIDYGFARIEPKNLNGTLMAIFKVIIRRIDHAQAVYDKQLSNGKLGGAPKGNKNAQKISIDENDKNLENNEKSTKNSEKTTKIAKKSTKISKKAEINNQVNNIINATEPINDSFDKTQNLEFASENTCHIKQDLDTQEASDFTQNEYSNEPQTLIINESENFDDFDISTKIREKAENDAYGLAKISAYDLGFNIDNREFALNKGDSANLDNKNTTENFEQKQPKNNPNSTQKQPKNNPKTIQKQSKNNQLKLKSELKTETEIPNDKKNNIFYLTDCAGVRAKEYDSSARLEFLTPYYDYHKGTVWGDAVLEIIDTLLEFREFAHECGEVKYNSKTYSASEIDEILKKHGKYVVDALPKKLVWDDTIRNRTTYIISVLFEKSTRKK